MAATGYATSHPGFTLPFTYAVPPLRDSATQFQFDHGSLGFFAQDQWKLKNKLSLTYGLRYDFRIVSVPVYGQNLLEESPAARGAGVFIQLQRSHSRRIRALWRPHRHQCRTGVPGSGMVRERKSGERQIVYPGVALFRDASSR
jgi:outer membrane receptor protein involved in Fe transport